MPRSARQYTSAQSAQGGTVGAAVATLAVTALAHYGVSLPPGGEAAIATIITAVIHHLIVRRSLQK